jgi:hypothetical protein
MKRLNKVLTFVFLMIVATGCSSSASDSPNAAPESKVKSINSDFVFMSDFLVSLKSRGIECTGYAQKKEVLLVKEEGHCNYMGEEITLDLFGDSKTTLEMVNSLKAFGGYWITSNNWVIVVQEEAIAKDISSKLEVDVL